MAKVKNYGLAGVGRDIQFGKQGPVLRGNAESDTFIFTAEDGLTLTRAQGANAVSSTDFVTKAQLDNVQTAEATFTQSVSHTDGETTLGTVPAGTKTLITTVTINTVFDGNSSFKVGVTGDQDLLMGVNYNDPSQTGSFQTVTTNNFSADTAIKVFPAMANVTQGNATIVVSYY